METKAFYADVILPLPVKGVFTYLIPSELRSKAKPGMRAIVQFGRKKYYTCLITRIHSISPREYEVKEIINIPDKKALVFSIQIDFWKWMAQYYMCTLGDVFNAALPGGLKPESETKIRLIESATDPGELSSGEEIIFHFLKARKVSTIKEINEISHVKNSLAGIHSLIGKGLLEVTETLSGSYKPKLQAFISIALEYREEKTLLLMLDKLSRAPRQKEALESFLHLTKKTKEISRKSFLTDRLATPNALDALIKKGILQLTYKKMDRISPFHQKIHHLKKLSGIQKKALKEIRDTFKSYHTVLFHGITSSGKTEIYAHLIEEQLKKGRQILYLLPEIAITSQMIGRLQSYFGRKICVYHSKYSDAERVEVWNHLVSGEQEDTCQIILGVRSSVFLPFNNLGLVIVDEEQENTYKQYDPAPRYHARDAAVYLAHLHHAKTLIGTATPSYETYFNCKTGKYGLVELKERHRKILLPTTLLADTKEAWRKRKMTAHFTPELYEAISEALKNKEQIILFQNRRGFSPYIQCNNCGWIPGCKNCDVNLTYHKFSNELKCHYCGFSVDVPKICPECGEPGIRTKGFGTEKIEEETRLVFPEASVRRLDLDTTRRKQAYQKIFSDFEAGNIDILIGTQMISKGLDFDNVRLVGVLNADNLLFFPDFRAYERTFQLLAQVSGRAGRKGKQGKVIIQTSDPKHPVLQYLLKGDYHGLFYSQIEERKNFRYPPFYKLIRITFKHKNQQELDISADIIGRELRKIFGMRILGPEPPLISKIQQYYLKTILMKIERGNKVADAKVRLQKVIDYFQEKKISPSLRIIIDVDPY